MSMDFINITMFVKFKVVSICHFVLLLCSVYTFSTLALSLSLCVSLRLAGLWPCQAFGFPFFPPAVSSHSDWLAVITPAPGFGLPLRPLTNGKGERARWWKEERGSAVDCFEDAEVAAHVKRAAWGDERKRSWWWFLTALVLFGFLQHPAWGHVCKAKWPKKKKNTKCKTI